MSDQTGSAILTDDDFGVYRAGTRSLTALRKSGLDHVQQCFRERQYPSNRMVEMSFYQVVSGEEKLASISLSFSDFLQYRPDISDEDVVVDHFHGVLLNVSPTIQYDR